MFDTLDNLKAFALPLSLQSKAGYDATLQAIGAGVASRIESWCNRRLARVSDDTYSTNGDRQIVVLPRYPLEGADPISKVELRWRQSDAWVEISDAISSIDEESGVVVLYGPQGDYQSRIRITYTGGYWFDTVGGQAQPAGSAALPPHVLLAWQIQCKHVWESLDKAGSSLSEKDWVSRLASLQLVPEVEAMLGGERRLA